MDASSIFALGMFVVLCTVLLSGFPVAFVLGGVSLFFAGIGTIFGIFDGDFLGALPQRIFAAMQNDVLLAVPLFVFMGVMLESSRIAEDMLEGMARIFGRLRGGMGISVVLVGALLAASTGIVGATVSTMTLLSLPVMLRWKYSPSLATGTICASGTLGQIIPPSIVLVLLADTISASYQKAQLAMGNFAPDTISISDLFAGAMIPGIILVGCYLVYQILVAVFRPDMSPAASEEILAGGGSLLLTLFPPLVLIFAVLGSILTGVATPTESAAVGAIGAVLLAGIRTAEAKFKKIGYLGVVSLILAGIIKAAVLRPYGAEMDKGLFFLAQFALVVLLSYFVIVLAVCSYKLWKSGVLEKVSQTTMKLAAMVFFILIGAAVFSLVFRGYGGDELVQSLLEDVPGGVYGALAAVMLVMFFLGFFLDFIEIIFVVVPTVAPVLLAQGVDPIWLAILIALNLQTSFLTPPFGFALFYLRGTAPPSVKTSDIYRGVMPFVFIQIAVIALIATYPKLTTWLPHLLYR